MTYVSSENRVAALAVRASHMDSSNAAVMGLLERIATMRMDLTELAALEERAGTAKADDPNLGPDVIHAMNLRFNIGQECTYGEQQASMIEHPV